MEVYADGRGAGRVKLTDVEMRDIGTITKSDADLRGYPFRRTSQRAGHKVQPDGRCSGVVMSPMMGAYQAMTMTRQRAPSLPHCHGARACRFLTLRWVRPWETAPPCSQHR